MSAIAHEYRPTSKSNSLHNMALIVNAHIVLDSFKNNKNKNKVHNIIK